MLACMAYIHFLQLLIYTTTIEDAVIPLQPHPPLTCCLLDTGLNFLFLVVIKLGKYIFDLNKIIPMFRSRNYKRGKNIFKYKYFLQIFFSFLFFVFSCFLFRCCQWMEKNRSGGRSVNFFNKIERIHCCCSFSKIFRLHFLYKNFFI